MITRKPLDPPCHPVSPSATWGIGVYNGSRSMEHVDTNLACAATAFFERGCAVAACRVALNGCEPVFSVDATARSVTLHQSLQSRCYGACRCLLSEVQAPQGESHAPIACMTHATPANPRLAHSPRRTQTLNHQSKILKNQEYFGQPQLQLWVAPSAAPA